MTTYFPKYTEAKAVLFKEDKSNMEEVLAFGGDSVSVGGTDEDQIFVETNNGETELFPGHYLMQGVSDFYPCDPVTFNNRWQPKADTVNVNRTALLESDDATVWADEFVRLVKQRPTIATDEATMTSWFASAMQNAISFERARKSENQSTLTDLLGPNAE